jgi:Putative transposase, YhgA-like
MRKNTKVLPKEEGKEEDALHHGGDKGFKATMKEKASALEYMSVFFPQLFSRLDITHFELDDTNYVSKGLKEYYSDVVYRTSLKQATKSKKKPVTIVLLFEHKKSISSYFTLFLQLLEYIVFIWREDWNNKKQPSIIVPIVVFQGKNGIKPKQLHDLFKGIPEEMLQYIPNLKYHLTNVHGVPDENLLMLEEKNLLRSLFLAYNFNKERDENEDILIEIFKFIKHNPEKMNYFQLFFEFMSKENYLSPDKIEELFSHYLSPHQKEGVMTTYQVWVNKGKQEGKQEGERSKARLVVLRGRWRGASVDFLADQSELPYQEVADMVNDYNEVYQFWSNKKGNKKALLEVAHLSEQEVRYLMNLFSEKQN